MNALDCLTTHVDSFVKISPVEIRVLAGQLQRLVPYQTMRPRLGDPMKLDETPFTLMVDQTPSMYAEPGDVT